MDLTALIDQQIDRGTATNQLLVWNNTTQRFEVSVSLDGLTLNLPVIAGTVNAGGQTTTFGTGLATFGGAVTATGTLTANSAFANGVITLTTSSGEWVVQDGATTAWVVTAGGNDYFTIDTSGEIIILGNATTNPAINFPGSGLTTHHGNVTILSPTPILVFQDSNSLGAASVGYIEWKDSGGGRAGFFGNHSSGNSDLMWKNEQAGNIVIQTTGAGTIKLVGPVLLDKPLVSNIVPNENATNGDFATGDFTNWTEGAIWDASTNKAVWTENGVGSSSTLVHDFVPTIGELYVVVLDYDDFGGSGTTKLEFAGNILALILPDGLAQRFIVRATTTDKLTFTTGHPPSGTYTVNIDNVSILSDSVSFSANNFIDTTYSGGKISSEYLLLDVDVLEITTDLLTIIGDTNITGVTTLGDGGIIDYSEFEDDGTLEFNGAATVFEDIVISLSAAKVPAANAPTWSGFISNLNAYTYGLNDFQEFTSEIAHSYKEGSAIEFHIHGATNGLEGSDKTLKFEIEYELVDNQTSGIFGDVYAGTTIINAEVTIPSGTTDKTAFVITVGTDTTGNFLQAATLVGRVRRIASSGTEPASDPFVLQVGVHIEQDTVGSRTALTK